MTSSSPQFAEAALRSLGIQDPLALVSLRELGSQLHRPLVPDIEGPWPDQPGTGRSIEGLRRKLADLGSGVLTPIGDNPASPRPVPAWYSVALFFNLPAGLQPEGYVATDVSVVREWLDEGTNPADPPISDFVQDYWRSVSYGQLNFGIRTPRDAGGSPLVPEVDPVDAQDFVDLAKRCIAADPEAAWRAAGGLTRDGKRWLPSIVVVQRYVTHASAYYSGWEQTEGNQTYLIGDVTHIGYSLEFASFGGVDTTGRGFWGTLTHELGHNFLEFGDLYGPQGCTGYWDLLGDNAQAGRMSEISSLFKQRVGWVSFKQEIAGPTFGPTALDLRPYTTTGEAFKIVPDPAHTPDEFFLLEFRTSTGGDLWRPDGALSERGLLITHVNTRMGLAGTWLLREAPYFDPEFADFSDHGAALWTGNDHLDGVLFPQHGHADFTASTEPSSDLYGGRRSGLSITGIRVEGDLCRFELQIEGHPDVGWTVGDRDDALVGRFTSEAAGGAGDEVFLRNDSAAALVTERQAQFVVVRRQDDWIGGWHLGPDNRGVVADVDGDGMDEVYLRSADFAGVLKWESDGFTSLTVQQDRVDDWNLGEGDRELAGDLNGDGCDEIYIRSPEWAGVLAYREGALRSLAVHNDRIDDWNLAGDNAEFIGRFTRPDRDEILVRSPDWIGVLQWNDDQSRLRSASVQHDRIGDWNLSGDDWQVVADLDGDGLDEVYIRSPRWAGVLKWSDGGFQCIWIQLNIIDHLTDPKPDRTVNLQAGDQGYAGRFLPDRDGILHRGVNRRLAVLTFDGGAMKVRHYLDAPLNGQWQMGTSDKYAVGRFQRAAADTGDPGHDFVSDVTAGAFIHNSWGTAAVGVNHLILGPTDIVSQMGLTWFAPDNLMITHPIVSLLGPVSSGTNSRSGEHVGAGTFAGAEVPHTRAGGSTDD